MTIDWYSKYYIFPPPQDLLNLGFRGSNHIGNHLYGIPIEHGGLAEEDPGTSEFKTRTSSWHGSLMVIAWILLALSETLISRYAAKTRFIIWRKKIFIDQVFLPVKITCET